MNVSNICFFFNNTCIYTSYQFDSNRYSCKYHSICNECRYEYVYIFRKWMGFPVRPGHVGPKLEVHIAQLTACSLGPAPGFSGVGFED